MTFIKGDCSMELSAKQKRRLFYYIIESRVYQVSDHLPRRFYVRSSYGKRPILSTEDGRKEIVRGVLQGDPFMIGRYGTSEGRALSEYYMIKAGLKKQYSKLTRHELCCNAGFFPNTTSAINRWAELLTDLSPLCDVLGVMNFFCEGWIVENICNNPILMPNGGVGSAKYGYTHCLEGKKVLVIHPMTNTIEHQYYNHREDIFPGTNSLPKFDLQTMKAVNTQADATDSRFKDWFEALDYMTDEVKKRDFDVAIVGCGAYGFPLAARIKQMGKIAIHMGGSVQYLFGIKSARSDTLPYFRDIYTDSWIYPDESDRPLGSEKVENGCYWKPL